uniref:Uncharacterized protein n=1 Tax=Romanomermis culicivorax TaxID=13658 RepID=A0A915IIK5_ROMCU
MTHKNCGRSIGDTFHNSSLPLPRNRTSVTALRVRNRQISTNASQTPLILRPELVYLYCAIQGTMSLAQCSLF